MQVLCSLNGGLMPEMGVLSQPVWTTVRLQGEKYVKIFDEQIQQCTISRIKMKKETGLFRCHFHWRA